MERFTETTAHELARAVPVPTHVLCEFIATKNVSLLLAELHSRMDRHYDFAIDDVQLREWIEADILNNDVPFFLQQDRLLYYGSSENLMARKKMKMLPFLQHS
jgi:hypothetical protein